MIHDILDELRSSNSNKFKLAVLEKHSKDPLLARILKMTYDTVVYRYYVSVNHWVKTYGPSFVTDASLIGDFVCPNPKYTLEQFLDFMLTDLSTRNLTGHDAINAIDHRFKNMSGADLELAIMVLNRDLRINCGRTQINKVFGDLITKPVYMRCGVYTQKTAKDIKFPAILQLKADGSYRECSVGEEKAEFFSRNGEEYQYTFADVFADLPSGHYTGEMIVNGTKNRAESNGLLNSDDVPMDDIVFYVWDYITPEEYSNASKKIPNKIPYTKRLEALKKIVETANSKHLKLIETVHVDSLKQAAEQVRTWMESDLEGGVLKDANGVYRDGTSKHQLKMKLAFSLDVRITGFNEGTAGTARESTFGSIAFTNDEGTIKGNVSGLSKDLLATINANRDAYINKIIEIEGNDLTKGRNNDYHAVSHPRLIEIRSDKDNTDTLERAMELRQMAMEFKL